MQGVSSYEIVSIIMPVMPAGQTPDIYNPGDLIEINEGIDGTWSGLVIGIAVAGNISSKGVVSVDQTLTLERHYGND